MPHQSVNSFNQSKRHVMGSSPKYIMPQSLEVGGTFLNCKEVISCQLSNLAVERACTVGNKDLGLAISICIEQHLAWTRKAGVVLEFKAKVGRREWNPHRFPAPAAVNDGTVEREKRFEELACVGGELVL